MAGSSKADMAAATAEAPQAQAPAPMFDLAALAALVRDTVEASVAPLRDEVAQMRAGQPRFVRLPPAQQPSARAHTYEPPEALRKRKLAKGQSMEQQSRWLDTPQGRQGLPPSSRPIFSPGDLVRLNPDAEIWGGGGRTWGEVLAKERTNPEGIGEVTGTMGLTETFEPKYKVSIRGFSLGASGFRESELLPYDGY